MWKRSLGAWPERLSRLAVERTGQATVELAVTLPLILTIVLGTVDLGRVYYASIATANGARAGAQYGCSSPSAAYDQTGIRNAVYAEMGPLADPSTNNPEIAISTGDDGSGFMQVTVSVAYTFHTAIPWPVIPEEIPMKRQISLRVVQ